MVVKQRGCFRIPSSRFNFFLGSEFPHQWQKQEEMLSIFLVGVVASKSVRV